MTEKSTTAQEFAIFIEKDVLDTSAALDNNNAVLRFLKNRIATSTNIEITKARCSAYKNGITNKNCAKCVGKCTDYFYIKEIQKFTSTKTKK